MHALDKAKLLRATKIYLTEDDHTDCTCFELRIQLPDNEYVLIDLADSLPDRMQYKSLVPNGFGLNERKVKQVTIYGQEETLKILDGSRNYSYNDPDTVDSLIALIGEMKGLWYP